MSELENAPPGTTRRTVLLGVGAMGVAALSAGALAACGTSAPPSPSDNGSGATGPGNGAPIPATASRQPIKVADIRVGGGAIYPDEDVVVTQPVAGQFKAFSATCTHEACLVTRIASGKIICPCHGSQYNIADGSVARGPAVRPLPPKTATVTGDTITVS
jgi:Rieske Fe-S protein